MRYVCPKCGGDDCGRDATASWDVQAQAFVLGTIYDQGWCNECGDVDLVEVGAASVEPARLATSSAGGEPITKEAILDLIQEAVVDGYAEGAREFDKNPKGWAIARRAYLGRYMARMAVLVNDRMGDDRRTVAAS